MSTKFFTNSTGNTLFDKFKGIAADMINFDSFLAVVGFFRSSGYFKLRKELGNVSEIKILVGINIDDIFRKHNKALLMLADEDKAKEIYHNGFKEDIINAQYSPEVEEGILQMCEDLVSGRLQMRIHATKNLHAKFYLCLPQNHSEHSDGWVIMGSSNISDSGLGIKQPPQYELNVAMKDFDDVKYCSDEFWALWNEAVPLTVEDIEEYKKKTYLGYQPTPYELYIKVLIDTFGDQVEDDFSIQLPDGVKDLKYQKDAVIQGYQMLMQHNGLFLADVVGLGKTMIATMIAKRFVEANGKNTNILVVYPPALEDNWRNTFKLFGIYKKAQFITNGSLSKVLDGKDNYKDKEGFCWNNVLTTYMKCKKKEKTVQSTESMSFFSCVNQVPEFYLISLMNSRFAAIYVDNFINSTSHCTTGDAKLIPVLIPDNEILKSCNRLFTSAFELKKSVAKGITTDISIQSELEIIEEENDNLIACLYSI